MVMHFPYLSKVTFEDDYELSDFGNACIHAVKETPLGLYTHWFFLTSTQWGFTDVEWYGPFLYDERTQEFELDTGTFTHRWLHVECVESKIFKMIQEFILKTGGSSVQVEDYNRTVAYDILDDMMSTLKRRRDKSDE